VEVGEEFFVLLQVLNLEDQVGVEVEQYRVEQEIHHRLVHHKEVMEEQELQIQDMDKVVVVEELQQ
jgi:hypothetical protein